MSNSVKVGEIFQAAGSAFNQLGELTLQLKGSAKGSSSGSSGSAGTKWTDHEIAQLHTAVHNFANELNSISETIKNRTVSQIKGALQKKAYDEAGIKLQATPAIQQSHTSASQPGTSKQVLNASESEVDVEGLGPPSSNFAS